MGEQNAMTYDGKLLVSVKCSVGYYAWSLRTNQVHQQSAWREGGSTHFILSNPDPPILERFKAAY